MCLIWLQVYYKTHTQQNHIIPENASVTIGGHVSKKEVRIEAGLFKIYDLMLYGSKFSALTRIGKESI